VTQDRPEAPELLDAVAEFLFAQVRPAVPSELRFRTLVAANVCAVVARELRAGEQPLSEDLDLFVALGADGGEEEEPLAERVRAAEADLAARLRAGELDGRLEETADALRAHVARKLDVARPGYDAPARSAR
jgi:Domain of unknown function (DUF6285)